MGIMENKMETTGIIVIVYRVYIGIIWGDIAVIIG